MKAIYKVADTVTLGLHSLVVHLARSGLTALGIVFAVWSVIAMLAINEGFSFESQQALRELGSDNIIIESVKPPNSESKASGQQGGALAYGLKYVDVARLRDSIPGIRRCVSVHRTLKYAYRPGKNLAASVIATEPTYAQVARTDLTAGRFLSAADVLQNKPYCLVTKSLARRIFGFVDPLGQTIRLGNEPFVVVGILTQLPRALAGGGGGDVGNHVIIPLTTDRTRFGEYTMMWGKGGGTSERVEVSQVILQMADDRAVLHAANIARSLLSSHHDEEDYEVTVPLELMEQRKKQQRLWNIMFLMIASISLVVGGIGIMNIMLASVTERTREIGVRRALGAKRRDIITQFLVESVTLTTVGGLLGIGIGMLVPWIVESFLNLKTIVSAATLLLPLGMAIVVGLVAGLYPAMRAARLDPIVALRHE
jgi:putative ABC transport system permease protein